MCTLIMPLYREYMKGGSGGAPPPEANGMNRSQIKRKLLLFDESYFFSFDVSLFFIIF